MTVVSTDPVKTKSDIESKASSLGGFVSDFSQQTNSYIYIQMTVEVPGDKLEVFLRQIGDSGVKVERQSVSSEDVTDSYYDTETRLGTTRDLLDHYRLMLGKAETIDETLQVQAKIDQLTLELESLQGRLNRLELLTSNSRVYIEIYQEKDPLLEKPSELEPLSWEHVKYFISNGFSRLGTVLLLVAQYLFIGLAVGLPVILVIVLIILIIYFAGKRKKKKRLAAAAVENNVEHRE
jgi:VIT1/CCC1 family predicted Fe2+/Mn2+ transporter